MGLRSRKDCMLKRYYVSYTVFKLSVERYLSRRTPLQTLMRFPVFLIALFLSVSLFGCSTYQNMTGYFNTFYNASKLFDEALTDVEKVLQKDRDTNYFAAYKVPPAAQLKFEKVIEKCSKLIQFYPQSAWVEDGIMMIGKSYVYLAEYEPASRKFNELITNFPESGHRFESRWWLALVEYYSKKDDQSLQILKALFPEVRAEGRNDLLLESLLLEAQIYFDRGEYGQSAATYELAIEVPADKRKRVVAQFQLGLCYEKLKESAKAAEAFSRVMEFGPDFPMEFKARLRRGVMLAEAGNHDQALEYLDELMQEQLKPEEYATTELEIANTYWLMHDSTEAFALYALIDTMYRRTDAAAKAYYQRGIIFEKELFDLKQALGYYNKARSENNTSSITPLALRRWEALSHYFKSRNELRRLDSLLTRALHPDTVKAGIKSDSTRNFAAGDSTRDSLLTALPVIDSLMVEQVTRPLNDSAVVFQPPDLPTTALEPPPDTSEVDDNPLAEEDLVKPLPGEIDPGLPRRPGGRESIPSAAKLQLGLATDTSGVKKALPAKQTVVSKSPLELRADIARVTFELATTFFLELDLPDSAIFWYRSLLEHHPESDLVPKAMYAMAAVYRSIGDTLLVDSLHRALESRFPDSEYATELKRVAGVEIASVEVDSQSVRYRRAEEFLADGKTDQAMKLFTTIAATGDSSLTAAKAKYTIGWIYENVLLNVDSAAAWYRLLLKDHPKSVYATAAQPKIAVKDDPKTLEKYIRINEIKAVAKSVQRRSGLPGTNKNVQDEDEEPRLQRGNRNNDPSIDDEHQQDEEPDEEPEESDDGGF